VSFTGQDIFHVFPSNPDNTKTEMEKLLYGLLSTALLKIKLPIPCCNKMIALNLHRWWIETKYWKVVSESSILDHNNNVKIFKGSDGMLLLKMKHW
jgi:hypothetical protein